MRCRKEQDFFSVFDEDTGFYMRSGIIRNGKDSGEDPFASSFPELLDVGIMGHCEHGKRGLCVAAGVECYQDGLHSDAPNMALPDFCSIVEQCKNDTYQIALGGCGDPDQHESFAEILRVCREAGIVPNFTTSGLAMDEGKAQLCAENCGAVAVSWYRSPHTWVAIEQLIQAGVRTNIHYVLTESSVPEALERLQNKSFPRGINAVVFLLHKPVGLGSAQSMVSSGNESFQALMKLVTSGTLPYKVGFDSCTVPALLREPGEIDVRSLDTCEGARWSAYISADMKMYPCSFDNQQKKWMVDLRRYSIQEAWSSATFEDFRNHFRTACPECSKRTLCLGGCPICPEIILCEEKTAAS